MNLPLQSPDQLAAHLRSLRQAQKLTQAQLGARIGVGQVRVADIERNPGAISVEQLLRVLHALDARLLLAAPKTGATHQPAPAKPAAADW